MWSSSDSINAFVVEPSTIVAFQSEADLVPDDTGIPVDVFVHAHS
jgi:hypothetical protein